MLDFRNYLVRSIVLYKILFLQYAMSISIEKKSLDFSVGIRLYNKCTSIMVKKMVVSFFKSFYF